MLALLNAHTAFGVISLVATCLDDWLVTAANPALLRSRPLLPMDSGGAVAAYDETEAVRRPLVGRLQIAAAVDWLG